MTVHQEIRAALETQIANVSGIPAVAQRQWDNVPFQPTTGTAYVRMQMDPLEARPAVAGPSPQIRFEGLFTVTVFIPEGQGAAAAEAIADAVRAAYTVDTVLTSGSTNVRIRYAEIGPGLQDSPWFAIPVYIAWYSYRAA